MTLARRAMDCRIARRVAVRYLYRQADQMPGQRREVKQLTSPLNKPVNTPARVQRQQGKEAPPSDAVKPSSRDIRPKDVFSPTPNNTGVLNLVETGRETGDQKKIKSDTGFATVRNLSQYLIKTDGGGGTPPQGQ